MNRKQKRKNKKKFRSLHGFNVYPKTVPELAAIICTIAEMPRVLESVLDEESHSHSIIPRIVFNLSGEMTFDDLFMYGLATIDLNDPILNSLVIGGVYMVMAAENGVPEAQAFLVDSYASGSDVFTKNWHSSVGWHNRMRSEHGEKIAATLCGLVTNQGPEYLLVHLLTRTNNLDKLAFKPANE